MPEPGCGGKTHAGKGDIGGCIDLTPGMAGGPGLARQPTIEDIGEGDAHIQQEQAHPPPLRSFTLRVDEEPEKQGDTPKPRQGEATRCGKVQGTHRFPSTVREKSSKRHVYVVPLGVDLRDRVSAPPFPSVADPATIASCWAPQPASERARAPQAQAES